jgi:hypothetical protein
MQKTILFAMAALVTATGALAAEPAPQEAKAEKKICRSENMTGSRTRVTKICMTEREWRELSTNTKQNIDKLGNPVASGQTQGN